MAYFLGVDVGGTKTHALIIDSSGTILGLGEAGPGNPEVIGYDGLANILNLCCGEAFSRSGLSAGQMDCATFGIAGYDWSIQLPDMEKTVCGLGLSGKIKIVNDALLGLAAGAPQGWGIVASAGTGNNVWGIDTDGKEGHITGNSGRYGEYGGASELVAEAVKQVAYMWTQRGPVTRLADLFLEITGAPDLTALLGGLIENRYQLEAQHAPRIFEVAQAGDGVANQVVDWSARELALSVLAVARQLAFLEQPFSLVLSGSLFRYNPEYRRIFEKKVKEVLPLAEPVLLEVDPVCGAALMAKHSLETVYPEVRKKLFIQAASLLRKT